LLHLCQLLPNQPAALIAGLDPLEVVEKVQELCLKLVVVKVGHCTTWMSDVCGIGLCCNGVKFSGFRCQTQSTCCSCMQGEDSLSTEARRNATFLFHSHLRATLAAKRVLSEYRLTQEAFAWLIGEIETRFQTVRAGSAASHNLKYCSDLGDGHVHIAVICIYRCNAHQC
jgi:RNA polymerase Rpb1, domain 6